MTRGERVRRHMSHWMRKNLVSKHFSKRKESEVEELKKEEQVRYRQEIEKEHKGKDPVLPEIRREKQRKKEEEQRKRREEDEEESRRTTRKLREKVASLTEDGLLELIEKSNITEEVLERIKARRREETKTDY
jgi:hypothetical protein